MFGFWNWREVPEFEKLIYEPPLGELGGRVLNTNHVRLLMDNWFIRESGALDGAPWHHDEPYFDFIGRMCILWIPLEPVPADDIPREG